MNSDLFTDRLKQVIGDESVRSFGARCGLSESSLRKYLAGTSEPGMSALIAIALSGEVCLEWLILNQGPMKKELKDRSSDGEELSLDMKVLQEAIETAEEILSLTGKKLTAAQKAHGIRLVYEYFMEDDDQSGRNTSKVIRLFKDVI